MCRNFKVLIFFAHEQMKKTPSKVGYFSKMAEICSTAHLPNLPWNKKVQDSFEFLYYLGYITLVGYWSLVVFSFVAARRKAAEGKRRIKTEEEELAGMFTYTMHTRMISLLEQCSTANRIEIFFYFFFNVFCQIVILIGLICVHLKSTI